MTERRGSNRTNELCEFAAEIGSANHSEVSASFQWERLARILEIKEAIAPMAAIPATMPTATFQSPSTGLGIVRATSAPRAAIV